MQAGGVIEEATRQGARLPLSWGPRKLLACTPRSPYHVRSKNHAAEGFIPFGLRLIFLFFEIPKQGKKQELALGSGSIG